MFRDGRAASSRAGARAAHTPASCRQHTDDPERNPVGLRRPDDQLRLVEGRALHRDSGHEHRDRIVPGDSLQACARQACLASSARGGETGNRERLPQRPDQIVHVPRLDDLDRPVQEIPDASRSPATWLATSSMWSSASQPGQRPNWSRFDAQLVTMWMPASTLGGPSHATAATAGSTVARRLRRPGRGDRGGGCLTQTDRRGPHQRPHLRRQTFGDLFDLLTVSVLELVAVGRRKPVPIRLVSMCCCPASSCARTGSGRPPRITPPAYGDTKQPPPSAACG